MSGIEKNESFVIYDYNLSHL